MWQIYKKDAREEDKKIQEPGHISLTGFCRCAVSAGMFDRVLFDRVFVATPSQLNLDLVSLKKSKLLPLVVKQTFLFFASQDPNF
jgi:hypothetical protein